MIYGKHRSAEYICKLSAGQSLQCKKCKTTEEKFFKHRIYKRDIERNKCYRKYSQFHRIKVPLGCTVKNVIVCMKQKNHRDKHTGNKVRMKIHHFFMPCIVFRLKVIHCITIPLKSTASIYTHTCQRKNDKKLIKIPAVRKLLKKLNCGCHIQDYFNHSFRKYKILFVAFLRSDSVCI